MSAHTACWMGKLEESPVGPIWIAATEKGVCRVSLWPDRERFEAETARLTGCQPIFAPDRVRSAVEQLSAYFRKELTQFDLPIDWSVMTPFQEQALRAVYAIPYGRVCRYGDIARQVGKPKAVRAVGRANATNPIPIIIPCHRVLGSDGKLHGFSAPGGLETKAWLLRLEGSWLI